MKTKDNIKFPWISAAEIKIGTPTQKSAMLFIFSGLPGTGKTTLSQALARRQHALHLRIDTIEQQLRESGVQDIGPMGYAIAYVIAKDNLFLGLHVVADTVNPIAIRRSHHNRYRRAVSGAIYC